MRITTEKLRNIIREELAQINEQATPTELYDRLVYLRNEHEGEFSLLNRLGEEGYRKVIQIRNDIESNPTSEDYNDYRSFFNRVKQEYNLFPNTIRNLWDERHETPDIEKLRDLKAEYDELSNQFELSVATGVEDSMYGRKRSNVIHKASGEIVNTGVNRMGSLGT